MTCDDDSERAGMGPGRQKETLGDNRRDTHFRHERQPGYFFRNIHGHSNKMDKPVSHELTGQDMFYNLEIFLKWSN